MAIPARTLLQQPKQEKAKVSTLLSHPDIVMKNPQEVLAKLLNISNDTKDKLHIITDFNMTLTKFWVDGKQNCDSFNVLEAVGAVSPNLTAQQAQLRKEYHHIASNSDLNKAEKEPLLIETIKRNNELYIDEKFTKEQLTEMLQGYPIVYRDGARELVDITALHQIPILVFSAGLGDVVTELMKSQDMLLPHMHVVSNFMEFHPLSNQITGFVPPLIHPLNKGTVKLENTPFCDEANKRTNVIVIGDSLGDLQMGSSLNHHTRLTVGILNHSVDSKLADFAENFDVVLTNDASFEWLNKVLASL